MQLERMCNQVMVEVRGGKAVKLVIKGEAVLPAVDIQEARLDFGEVYTGVTARIPMTIINTTPVLAGMTPPPAPPPPPPRPPPPGFNLHLPCRFPAVSFSV